MERTISLIKSALFNEFGDDKDVTKTLSPDFLNFIHEQTELSLQFKTRLSEVETRWAFDLIRENMEDRYDDSGYGWDDDDKLNEIAAPGSRYLVVKNQEDLVGILIFRFTVQGEVVDQMIGKPILFLSDLHILPEYQRKGLGKHLLTLLEHIAREEKMNLLCVPVLLNDETTLNWLTKAGEGLFQPDPDLKALAGFEPELEGFTLYSKPLNPPSSSLSELPDSVFRLASLSLASAPVPAPPISHTSPSSSSTSVERSTHESESPAAAEEEEEEWDDVDEEESEKDRKGEEDDQSLDFSALDPEEMVAQLSLLFQQEHGREPTEDEKEMWRATQREAAEENTTH